MDTLLRILCCINARDVWLLLIRVSSNTLQFAPRILLPTNHFLDREVFDLHVVII